MGACASKQNQRPFGASSTGRHSADTDMASPKAVLNSMFPVLVDCLQPDPILKEFLKLGHSVTTIQNIMELQTTNEKNRQLLELVNKRWDNTYRHLKKALRKTGQEEILNVMEMTEEGHDTSHRNEILRKKARERIKAVSEEDKLYEELKEGLECFYNDKESMIPISPLLEENAVPLMDLYVQPPISVFIKSSAFGQGHKPEKKRISSFRELFINNVNVPYKNIYVEAGVGNGKTSFAQKIAMTWCQAQNWNKLTCIKVHQDDVNILKHFDLLFLLHLRDFQGDMCLLDDLILKFVTQNLPCKERFSKEFLSRMLQTRTCLAIIDGLDEWVHPENCPQRPGIPHNNYRERLTQLTTTRPWKISTLGLTPNLIDRHAVISELDEDASKELKSNTVKLLSKIRDTPEPDLNDFDRKVSLVKLEDICLIPYILLQLVCIWLDGLSIGESKCETYSNTIELTLKRGLKKKNAPILPTENIQRNATVTKCIRRNELCNQYLNLLLKLGKLAFYTLFHEIKESSLVIENTTVLKFLTEHDFEFSLKIGLLSQTKDSSKISVKRYKVSFQHKSVHEFMAALYITSEWNNETTQLTICKVCSSHSSILEMENLFVFVCGMNPEVYTCISGELQKVIERDLVTCRYRTKMYLDYEDTSTMKSYQSMQVKCVQESVRNGNESCGIYLPDIVLDKYSLTEDYTTAFNTLIHFNKDNVKSLQLSLDKKTAAVMQSLDLGVFTSLNTLRVDECDEEPEWLADILTESARTLLCLTLSGYEGFSLSEFSITALTGLTCLQSLCLYPVTTTHSNIQRLYAYISQTTTLTQVKLESTNCTNHKDQYRDCDVTLDLHRLNKLERLELCDVKMSSGASKQLFLGVGELTQLQYIKLAWIDVGDLKPRFSPAMTNLTRVVLQGVTILSAALVELFLSLGQLPRSITVKLSSIRMTSKEWRELLLSVGGLPQSVMVELSMCEGPFVKEWKAIVEVIKSTPTLSLLQDLHLTCGGGASLTLKNKADL